MVSAYQETNPLTIGELWAIPITLRLILIENLRRMAETIIWGRRLRREADLVADYLLGLSDRTPTEPIALDRYESAELPQPFAVQLLLRLRDHDPDTTPGLTWLQERLAASGTHPDEVVNETHRRQAASNVTVRNIVTSLRHINSFDWAEFVEGGEPGRPPADCGEQLRRDEFLHPGPLPPQHRRAVEAFPRIRTRGGPRHPGVGRCPAGDAARAIPVTSCSARAGASSRPRSVSPAPVGMRISRFFRRHAMVVYAGSIALIAALAIALPLLTIGQNLNWRWVMALLALIPATDIAVTVVNRAVAALTHPEELPSLALRHGPTEDLRTMVAIPALAVRGPNRSTN